MSDERNLRWWTYRIRDVVIMLMAGGAGFAVGGEWNTAGLLVALGGWLAVIDHNIQRHLDLMSELLACGASPPSGGS